MIPWMYLCYNKEFNSNSQRNQPGVTTADEEGRRLYSLNSSRPVGMGTSTNINKSVGGLLNANVSVGQYNSGLNES
jgi:hypothetical protein